MVAQASAVGIAIFSDEASCNTVPVPPPSVNYMYAYQGLCTAYSLYALTLSSCAGGKATVKVQGGASDNTKPPGCTGATLFTVDLDKAGKCVKFGTSDGIWLKVIDDTCALPSTASLYMTAIFENAQCANTNVVSD